MKEAPEGAFFILLLERQNKSKKAKGKRQKTKI